MNEILIALHGDSVQGPVVVARFARCEIELQQMSDRQIFRKRQVGLQIPLMHRHHSAEGDAILSREVGRDVVGNSWVIEIIPELLTELVADRG